MTLYKNYVKIVGKVCNGLYKHGDPAACALNIALFNRLYCISSVVINGGIDTFHGQLV